MCDRCARPPACLPVCHPIFDQFVSFSELMNRPLHRLQKWRNRGRRVIYNNQVQSREGGRDRGRERERETDAKVYV